MGVGGLDTNLDTRVSSSTTSLNQSEFDAREATGSESRGRKRRDKPKQLFQLSTRKENLIKDLAYDDCQKLYEFLYGSSEPETTTPPATASSETNTPNPSSAESSPQALHLN